MRPLAAAGLFLIAAVSATAQSEDIFERLQQALGPLSKGKLASAELRAKEFSQVQALLESAHADNASDRAELLALRGAVAFLEGKMAASASLFRESEKLRPGKEADHFTLAMALVKLGDDGQARQVLAGLSAQHPEKAVYWYWLGRIDFDQRRYSESVEKLQKATECDPQSTRAWDSLGLAWDMQGHTENAHESFNKAVKLNRAQQKPSAWPPHNLGELLFRMGQTAEAETALRESLSYDSNLPRTHYYLARVLEKEGRNDEAIDQYRSAVNADPAASDACYSLAMLYRKLHRDSEANVMFAEYRKRKK